MNSVRVACHSHDKGPTFEVLKYFRGKNGKGPMFEFLKYLRGKKWRYIIRLFRLIGT
jgi:hypothetical protein